MAVETKDLSEIWNPLRPRASQVYSGPDLNHLPLYRYSKLRPNEIRLLHIFPGSGPTHIACALHTVNLAQPQLKFEAVSYCWGGSDKACNIRIANRRLPVTESAVDALWQFRESAKKRIVWLDAICINQEDLDEKNQQVRMMGEIYRRAARVLAWAGGQSEGSRRALRTVWMAQARLRALVTRLWLRMPTDPGDAYFRMMRSALDGFFNSLGPADRTIVQYALTSEDLMTKLFQKYGWWREYLLYDQLGLMSETRTGPTPLARSIYERLHDQLTPELILDLYKLAQRPYFARVWIIQELVLAQAATLHIGNECIAWDDFATAMLILTNVCGAKGWTGLGVAHTSFSIVQDIRIQRQAMGFVAWRMTSLCLVAPLHQATVPVDRLFAFYSISSEVDRVEIDYKRPAHEVYLEAGQTMCRSTEDGPGPAIRLMFDMVAFTDLHEYDKLPSWVPDFGAISLANVQSHSTFNTGFGAEISQAAELKPGDPRVLVVHGLQIARIAQFVAYESPELEDRLRTRSRGVKMNFIPSAGAWSIAGSDSNSLLELLKRQPRAGWAVRAEVALVCQKRTISDCAESIRKVTHLLTIAQEDEHEACWTAIAMPQPEEVQQPHKATNTCIPAWAALINATPDLTVEGNWTASHPALNALSDDDLEALVHFSKCDLSWIGTRFCRFDHGRFGWVPERSRVGDTAYVLARFSRPYILRSFPDGRTKNLGHAYVEGSMDSETFTSSQWASAERIEIS